MNMLLISLQT